MSSLKKKSERSEDRSDSRRKQSNNYDDADTCSYMMEEKEECNSLSSLDSLAFALSSSPSGPPPTELFMQQQFDGSFQIDDTLASLLNTSSSALRSRSSSESHRMGSLDASTIQKLWATIYVLGMLQKWWSAYENSWEMIADKAKGWAVGVLTRSLGDRVTARRCVDELIASV